MKRERYCAKYPAYLPTLRKVAAKSGLEYDAVEEVIASATSRILERKTYTKIASKSLRVFLISTIRYASREHVKDSKRRAARFCRMPEADDATLFVETSRVQTEAITCPFCHRGELNMHGGCKECHTILPSNAPIRRNILRMDEVSLAVEFDYAKQIDIRKALCQLTEREQTVVKAVVMGEESLASLAELTGISGPTLWRSWLVAKEKLQGFLREYAEGSCPKRPLDRIQRALNPAPVAGLQAVK